MRLCRSSHADMKGLTYNAASRSRLVWRSCSCVSDHLQTAHSPIATEMSHCKGDSLYRVRRFRMCHRAARQDRVHSVLPRVPIMAPAQLAACAAQCNWGGRKCSVLKPGARRLTLRGADLVLMAPGGRSLTLLKPAPFDLPVQ